MLAQPQLLYIGAQKNLQQSLGQTSHLAVASLLDVSETAVSHNLVDDIQILMAEIIIGNETTIN